MSRITCTVVTGSRLARLLRGDVLVVDSIDLDHAAPCDCYVDGAYWQRLDSLGATLASKAWRYGGRLGKLLHSAFWGACYVNSMAVLDAATDALQADGSFEEPWFERQLERAEDAADHWADR